jgi:glycosyltransferase involved in cell wall biosynthesis
MRIKKVSIVIPAKNEEETIGRVMDEINDFVSKNRKYAFETIVVVDSETDKTVPVARDKGARVVINSHSSGKGRALDFGFKNCTGDVIVMMDGDCSHNPYEMELFFKAIEDGADFVVGTRALGGSSEYEIIRLFGNTNLTALFCFLFWVMKTDALNGYKAFLREIVDGYTCKAKGLNIEIELLARALKLGYKTAEVPSHENERAGGVRKSRTLFHGFEILFSIITEGLSYRFMRLFKKNK